MRYIICDTMIWYELSKGRLVLPDKGKYTLVCTYLSLMELAFSPNNFKRLAEVQQTIRYIFDLKPELSLSFPLDYAKALIDGIEQPEINLEEDMVFTFLRMLMNQPKEGLKEGDFHTYLKDISSRRKHNNDDWRNFLNDLNGPAKEVRSVLKKYWDDELEHQKFQKIFTHDLNSYTFKTYTIEDICWDRFEFYGNIYKGYERNLFTTMMKADANDVNDLRNMIYVQPDDLYWTLEKRWLTIARETKSEHYLYKG